MPKNAQTTSQLHSSQFSSVQSLSRVRLFATPWIAAHQASLSITNSRSSPKLMCIESVMPSSHLILCCSRLLRNFVQFVVIHIIKGFGVVSKAKVDVFLELSYFYDDLTDVGNLISGSSSFSKTSLNICKFTVYVLLKPGLENFEHYFASIWDECSCVVVWAFFGIAFLWDWNEHWPFPVLWPLLSFPHLLAYWVQHFHLSGFEIAQLEFHHLH